MIIIAYLLTIGLAAFGLTSAPIALIGGGVARLSGPGLGVTVGMIVGGIATWLAMSALWSWLAAGPIPITALAASFLAITAHSSFAWSELNAVARRAAIAEMWAILFLAIGLAALPGSTRWY